MFSQTVPDRWFAYDDLNQEQQKKVKNLVYCKITDTYTGPGVR